MKLADNITVIINVNGNNDNVNFGKKASSNQSKLSVKIILAIIAGVLVIAAVLTVAHICPDKLAGFVRVLISLIGG